MASSSRCRNCSFRRLVVALRARNWNAGNFNCLGCCFRIRCSTTGNAANASPAKSAGKMNVMSTLSLPSQETLKQRLVKAQSRIHRGRNRSAPCGTRMPK